MDEAKQSKYLTVTNPPWYTKGMRKQIATARCIRTGRRWVVYLTQDGKVQLERV